MIKTGDNVRIVSDVFDAYGSIGRVVKDRFHGCVYRSPYNEVEIAVGNKGDWSCHLYLDSELVRVPSFADELRLKPSTRKVLAYLRRNKTITPEQSRSHVGVPRLSAAIFDLRNIGFRITSHDIRRSHFFTGAKYKQTRYELVD